MTDFPVATANSRLFSKVAKLGRPLALSQVISWEA